MPSEFRNKVVVITGAAGNLGRAVATAFAGLDARLALLDLNEQTLDAMIGDLPAGTDARGYPINLLESSSVNEVMGRIAADLGGIDVLANIAGGFVMGPLTQDTEDKDWDFMMNLNARSVFYATRAAIPSMLDNEGGRIVNVSARAALSGRSRMGPYCASKAAVKTLTESLAAEYRFDNINVNCILPGTIDTPQNRESMPDANFSHWVPPAALADVVVFLASDAARCVTGAAVPVYGRS